MLKHFQHNTFKKNITVAKLAYCPKILYWENKKFWLS